LAGRFPAPGLWTAPATNSERQLSLEIVPRAALEQSSARPGWTPLLRLAVDAQEWILSLDQHREEGHLVHLDGFGSYLVAPDGRRALLAPAPIEPWRWQRLLTAQVLPIAALSQRMELFHASAVAVDDRALAIAGGSGSGKTTLAAQLMLAGATFVCDDALAVEETRADVIAHPGPALMNLRDSSAQLLGSEWRAELGTHLGCDEAGPRLLIRRKAPPLPLSAIYVLRRRGRGEGTIRVSRLSPPAPELLLGLGFATAIRSPARLIRRLDLCASLANRIAVVAIEAPAHAPPAALADAVLRHAHRSVP
jgi:hypothetical protein